MATTVKKLIRASMQKCGILTMSQEPTADEINDGLVALNNMLSSWSNDSMMCFARKWETFNLVANQQNYLIGKNAPDFNTGRPIKIVDGYIRLPGQSDYDLEIVNDEIFTGQIRQKSTPGTPEWLNYDNGYPLGTIRLWPVPPTNYQMFLLSEKELSQFGLNDSVDLPPGWERAITFNLPFEIAGDYGQEVPDTVQKIAVDSKSSIQMAVQKNRSLDAQPQQGNSNNIYSGWNR